MENRVGFVIKESDLLLPRSLHRKIQVLRILERFGIVAEGRLPLRCRPFLGLHSIPFFWDIHCLASNLGCFQSSVGIIFFQIRAGILNFR